MAWKYVGGLILERSPNAASAGESAITFALCTAHRSVNFVEELRKGKQEATF
jgi:hypothetical protein